MTDRYTGTWKKVKSETGDQGTGRVRVGVSDRVSQTGIKNETEIKSVTQKVRMKEVKKI